MQDRQEKEGGRRGGKEGEGGGEGGGRRRNVKDLVFDPKDRCFKFTSFTFFCTKFQVLNSN